MMYQGQCLHANSFDMRAHLFRLYQIRELLQGIICLFQTFHHITYFTVQFSPSLYLVHWQHSPHLYQYGVLGQNQARPER